MYYNQGKWINEHEYGKGWYYNEYYDDDLDLVTTDESSCSGESEAESHNDFVPQEMFFVKEKKLFWYLQKNYQLWLMPSHFANPAIILSG